MEAAIAPLHRLAEAAGLARTWRDVAGRDQEVPDEALAAILDALGYAAGCEAAIAESLALIAEERRAMPALLAADVGCAIRLPTGASRAELVAEGGTRWAVEVSGRMLPPIGEPGYYKLIVDAHEITLAVAPRRCPLPSPAARSRLWGPTLQIPALRGTKPAPFGDFGDLHAAVQSFARRGADAVAINPVHAMFAGHGIGFSPYSPSSRLFLNAAMGDPKLVGLPPLPEAEGGAFIDWEAALPERLAHLRALHAALDAGQRARTADDNARGGEGLMRHAIFDAIDCRLRPLGSKGWREWPAGLREPDSAEVRRFAADHAEEVRFHLFTQWLARESLLRVQRGARAAGMSIGLVADLAVGVDPGGSDAWSMQQVMLQGLMIGAPPDPFSPLGQNWGLTGFSPKGLMASGFAPWITMLRQAFAGAGGLRIDHAFSLSRLWVVPQGASSGQGAYLDYPLATLLRLATLEAHRAGALVIAEDLGTSPEGFREAIADRGMLGMRVLWFERAADHGFIGAGDYAPMSAAMTGTHDTATVAGWWKGRDLDWAERLGRLPEDCDRSSAEAIRDWDRGLLWSTIGNGEPRPAPDAPEGVVDAALAHISHSPALLAIAPLEDLLATDEQPNLPGTVTGHPNWRRRLALPLEDLLDEPATVRRIDRLAGNPRAG